MLSTAVLVLVAGLLASPSQSITLRRSVGEPRVLGLDIERRSVSNLLSRDRLWRRDSKYVQASLANEVG